MAPIASRLGLSIDGDTKHLKVSRGRMTVALEGPRLPSSANLSQRVGWHHALTGVRLGLDRGLGVYDYSTERPDPEERPRSPLEKRSVYGDRLQRLVHDLTWRWAERVSGENLFRTPWFEGYSVLYIREVQQIWHAWAEVDFEQADFDRDNLLEFSRLALFYESYKPRPDEEKLTWGRIRTYTSTEGLTASRALLMPDFDYDASAAGGFFSIPGRDTMLVAEPAGEEHQKAARDSLVQRAAEHLSQAVLPFGAEVFQLERTAIAGVSTHSNSVLAIPTLDEWTVTA